MHSGGFIPGVLFIHLILPPHYRRFNTRLRFSSFRYLRYILIVSLARFQIEAVFFSQRELGDNLLRDLDKYSLKYVRESKLILCTYLSELVSSV